MVVERLIRVLRMYKFPSSQAYNKLRCVPTSNPYLPLLMRFAKLRAETRNIVALVTQSLHIRIRIFWKNMATFEF